MVKLVQKVAPNFLAMPWGKYNRRTQCISIETIDIIGLNVFGFLIERVEVDKNANLSETYQEGKVREVSGLGSVAAKITTVELGLEISTIIH